MTYFTPPSLPPSSGISYVPPPMPPHLLILLGVPRLLLDEEEAPHLEGQRQKDLAQHGEQQLGRDQAVGRPLGDQLLPRAVQAHWGEKQPMRRGVRSRPSPLSRHPKTSQLLQQQPLKTPTRRHSQFA